MTYAQSKGHHTIDRQYFLDHPPTTGDGWKLAEKAALGYIQDPGGCLPAELPRGPGGELEDEELNRLTRQFYLSIFQRNIGEAKFFLEQINNRATGLLTKIKENECLH